MRVVSIESCAQRLKISLTDKINFDYRLFAPKFFPRRRTGVKACRFIDNRLKITRFREVGGVAHSPVRHFRGARLRFHAAGAFSLWRRYVFMRAPRERHHVAALSGTDAMEPSPRVFRIRDIALRHGARFPDQSVDAHQPGHFQHQGRDATGGDRRAWPAMENHRQPAGVLRELAASKEGAAFIGEKIQGMNRGAFHRSAFALNAFTQLGFVDLAAQLSMTLPQLKWRSSRPICFSHGSRMTP